MPQPKTKSRFRFLPRWGLSCLGGVILFSFFFHARAVFAVDVSPANFSSTITNSDAIAEATNHIGKWIWDVQAFDKQTCQLWKSFVIPPGAVVSRAILRITVDNGYQLFLDGQEIGRGSDWRTLTEYDVTWLLNPGKHVLAVEAFNDRLAGGLMFGLEIELVDQRVIEIVSDDSWRIVPNTERGWVNKKNAPVNWPSAKVVGAMGQDPWLKWPIAVMAEPPLHPVVVHFWQTGWFQLSLLAVCVLAILFCLWLMTQLAAQSQAQRFLQLERARIARDIHDDLGARLTELVLLGEVMQSELPADSETRGQFNQICEKARGLSHALDEIVWAINSRRDTLRDFVSYVCKYAQLFLSATPIRCRLDVEPEIPAVAFDLPIRRNLFLAVKEALNNAAKHSEAGKLFLRIYRQNQKLSVVVEDDGKGFDPAQTDLMRNGVTNMAQRMHEVRGTCCLSAQPGQGCRVEFMVPLKSARHLAWFQSHRRDLPDESCGLKDSRPASIDPARDATNSRTL
jgi:two-component sensor histidine kinase